MEQDPYESFHEDIPLFFTKLAKYPEFHLSSGNMFQKLVNVCYYQIGDFEQAVPMLLLQFFQKFSQDLNIQVIVQDIRFRILTTPVYKIPADVAIMNQDVYRVVGPVEESLEEVISSGEQNISEQINDILANFKISNLGEIKVSRPKWCKSQYLLEAIIYHFQENPISTEKIIQETLKRALQECNTLQFAKIALDPLGTEFRVISEVTFVKILHQTLMEMAGELKSIREIIISARNNKHADLLKKAFKEVLRIKF